MARAIATKRRMKEKNNSSSEGALEEQRRAQLVAAVVACISEEGFERTTTRNIAERAGVSIGMLNYYYKSKKELVVEAIRHANRGILQALADTDAGPFGPKRLEFIINRTLRNEYPQALPLAFRLAVMAAAAHDADLRREVCSWLEDGRAKFEKSIAAGIAARAYRDDINPRLLSIILYSAMTGVTMQAAVCAESMPIGGGVDAVLRILQFFEEAPQPPVQRKVRGTGAAMNSLAAELLADPKLSKQDAQALTSSIKGLYDHYCRASRKRLAGGQ
jgi:TetR/AcrR family transcriptional repressor of bet genes